MAEQLESRRLLAVPAYSSLPGAFQKLFLDFDGNPAFTFVNNIGTYQAHGAGPTTTPIPAFSMDGAVSDNYSDAELDAIQKIWRHTAEKYSPFNINVTTVDPGNRNDDETQHVLIGGSNSDWYTGGGGLGAIGGFYNAGLSNSCFVWSGDLAWNNADDIAYGIHFTAETAAHEAGHGFGLEHQRSPGVEYYNGDSVRTPIMGNSPNNTDARGIWWKTNVFPGQNSGDSIQDELLNLDLILGYRADDRGNDAGSAHPMSGSAGELYSTGVIERVSDADWFSFSATTISAQITIARAPNGPMLGLSAELYTAGGAFIANGLTDGAGNLNITANILSPGASYRVRVAGQGNYGDVGQYSVTSSLGKFASLNTDIRTIFVQGISGLNDNITVYADFAQGTIAINDNGGILSWPVNFVDSVVVSLSDNGDDTINIMPINPFGNPNILVYGGSGFDSLNVFGTTPEFPSAGNDVIDINASSVYVTEGGATFTELDLYTGIERLNVGGDLGNDIFNINSTAVPVEINGGAGFDWAVVGGTAASISAIHSGVSFLGDDGADLLIINDANYAGTRTYTFSTGFITDGVNNYSYFGAVENVIVNGAAGGCTFDVAALFGVVTYAINGGNGNDNVIFGGSFQNVTATAQGAVTVNGGSGNDTMTFNDQGGTSDFVVGPTDVFFVGTPGIVHYNAGLENIVINGGSSGNYFNIDGPNLMTAVQINAGNGNDTIQIAYISVRLDSIGADLSVDGQGGSDTLSVHNANGLARNETLSATSVNDGVHTYGYAGVESLSIDLSQFDETMYIISSSPSTYTTIYSNDGNDTCYFLTSDLANTYGITYWGQGGSNTATLNDQSATGSHTYDISASAVTRGTFAFSHGSLAAMEINASDFADTINLSGAVAGTPVTVNGGGGNDTFTVNGSGFIAFGLPNITLSGGSGIDTFTFDDQFTPGNLGLTYNTNDASLSRSFSGFFFYNTMEAVNLMGTGGADTVAITATAAGCNVFVYGGGGSDAYIVGGSFLPTVNNIVTLLEIQDTGGANTLTINDATDTTGDSVRVEPFLVYNGPGAPFFGTGGVLYYTGMSSLTINLGGGADTIYAKPTNQNPVTINANNPTSPPGDILNLAFAAVTNPIFTPGGTGAGGYTFANASPLNYTGIESTAIDSVAPTVTNQLFNFNLTVQSLDYFFSEDVSTLLSSAYLTLTNLTTGQIVPSAQIAMSYDAPSNRARFTFPSYPFGALPDGNYRAVLSNQVADLFGNWLPQSSTLDFFSLVCDANRDKKVDTLDFNTLAGNFGLSGRSFGQGNFDYSFGGAVDTLDFNLLAGKFGKTLPVSGSPGDSATAVAAAGVAGISDDETMLIGDRTVDELFSQSGVLF